MCCFSNAPAFDKVEGTQIFARFVAPGRQALAYSMTVSARGPLAMILPLPVASGAGEDALEFVDLSGCPRFFHHLNQAFPSPAPRGGFASRALSAQPAPLKVHQVGDFEASFVPSIPDFERLDPRFRIEPTIWSQLPTYADYGFAVFQLRGFEAGERGFLARFRAPAPRTKTVHPMAFVFPRRHPNTLFFPTVHIHDGEVHPRAAFDHTLYAQGVAAPTDWARSAGTLGGYLDLAAAQDLVADTHAVRRKLVGTHDNTDILLTVGAA